MTLVSLQSQENDALIINLAGRQRMFTQQMTWMALNQSQALGLSQSMTQFERNLHALKNGGETLDAYGNLVTLPPAPDGEIPILLDKAIASWSDFQARINQLQSLEVGTTEYQQLADRLQTSSQVILIQLDEVVSAFEKRAQEKVAQLWVVQAIFLAAAVSLLLIGSLFIRHRIVKPLEKLGQVARRIGTGDLDTAVPPLHKDELGQLAGVMESMRVELSSTHQLLHDHVEQRTKELAEAFEFSTEIVAQLDLDILLQSVTDRSRKLMRANEASLCLSREDGRVLELVASQGSNLPTDGLYQSVERGIALQVIGEGKTIARQGNICDACAFMRGYPFGNCLAAPLKIGSTILGALCVVRDEEFPFSAEETQAMTLLANTAAIAITNARLVEQERIQTHQSAVLTERQRLAAELHDNLAQTLSFLRFRVEHISNLVPSNSEQVSTELLGIQNTLNTVYDQVRDVIIGITPKPIETESLTDQLAGYMSDFQRLTAVPVEFTMESPQDWQLNAVEQVQFFYIIRESLTNIRRHARAKKVAISLARINGNICCEISDDGCGFDLRRELNVDQLGLKIMHTRAERVGGYLEIQSAPGQGTKVILTMPLAEAA